MKHLFDTIVSSIGLLILSPFFVLIALYIKADSRGPVFFIQKRIGRNFKPFNLYKFRTMVHGSGEKESHITSGSDLRITAAGRYLRITKIDELPQLFNVLIGDMRLVGPRPNVERETDLYTDLEKRLLKVKPGLTDFASIIFSDEGQILDKSQDPELDYNQLIRPWKSRLGLEYVDKRTFVLDIKLIFFTAIALFSRKRAMRGVSRLLQSIGADQSLLEIAIRSEVLTPHSPPGATDIVTSGDVPPG